MAEAAIVFVFFYVASLSPHNPLQHSDFSFFLSMQCQSIEIKAGRGSVSCAASGCETRRSHKIITFINGQMAF